MKINKLILAITVTLFGIQIGNAQKESVKVTAIGFYNLENLFDTEDDPDIWDEEFTPDGVAERIAPVGHVVKAGQVVAVVSAGGAGRSGSDIYGTNCMACHTSGIAGAPMLGDAGAWTDRLTKGIETVYTNAINGINGMPARGTCMDCSDDEVIAAIDYILDNSK